MSTKRKHPPKLGQPVLKQSAKVFGKAALDESKTVVLGGGAATKKNTNGVRNVVDISSDSSSAEEIDSDAEEEEEEEGGEEVDGSSAAGEDVAMDDAEVADSALLPEETEDSGEPSLGELVQANNSEPIDVAGAFAEAKGQAVSYPKAHIQPPSGASLGTVLTQALRTNDIALLESCLHTTSGDTIRATIQRLESPLAGTLLLKLAERLYKRPGRAGSLMIWVQWTLITHGGYLATQPDLLKQLTTLNQVIDNRSRGLQSVLLLKGKLDMLEAQIDLRRSMQNQRRQLEQEDDDEGVIYVEGQEDEEDDHGNPRASGKRGGLEPNPDNESITSDDMNLTNGVEAESDGAEESSDDDDLIDDEAEETDNDSGDEDEDEVDHDDQDFIDDDDSDDGDHAAPPSKMARITGGQFSKRR